MLEVMNVNLVVAYEVHRAMRIVSTVFICLEYEMELGMKKRDLQVSSHPVTQYFLLLRKM